MNDRSTVSTTIRVSKAVRDEIGALAAAAGVTLDEMLRQLTRAERQRRIGTELASLQHDELAQAVIGASAVTVTR